MESGKLLIKKSLVLQEKLCIKQQTASQKYVYSFTNKQRRLRQAASLNVAIMMAVTESQAEYLNELRKCVERPAALFPERKFLRYFSFLFTVIYSCPKTVKILAVKGF